MPEFSSSKIIELRFHVNNNKVDLFIGYDRIICHDLMVHLVLMANFKPQVLQWDGKTVIMEEIRGLIGKSE